MSQDCKPGAINGVADCSKPWGLECHKGFDVLSFWSFTQNIQSRCPSDSRLALTSGESRTLALTKNACEHIAGRSWKAYDNSVWWTRLTTWKFPLLQLVAQFLRPPLTIETKLFVMAHLLGDPIDTVKNLLLKLSKCQRRAEEWKIFVSTHVVTSQQNRVMDSDGGAGSLKTHPKVQYEQERHWRSLSLLVDAYDEWGDGDEAHKIIKAHLEQVQQVRDRLLEKILETGDALAADRATQYLPMVVALAIFCFNIIVAVIRIMLATGGASLNNTIFINIEMHGIAFSTLFFWIIPAVLMSSVIGVSQTEHGIRRILLRFHKEIEHIIPELKLHSELQGLVSIVDDGGGDDTDRWFKGGLYSWHSSYWHRKATDPDQTHDVGKPQKSSGSDVTEGAQGNDRTALLQGERSSPGPPPIRLTHGVVRSRWYTKPVTLFLPYLKLRWLQGGFIALLCVFIPSIFGMLLSGSIPPDGINCRVWGEFAIFVCWFLSHELNIFLYLACKAESKKLFWSMYAKDLAFTLATIVFIFVTHLGCFNRCSCWLDKDSNLILPQRPDIDLTLRHRLRRRYPAFIFSALAVELGIIPFSIFLKYRDALLVYVQRDDGKPNTDWFQKKVRKMRRWKPGFGRRFS